MSQRTDDVLGITGCCIALATLVPVALFQSGWIAQLPDPPYPLFASERITASAQAYPFGVPDSFLGLASYTTTLGLFFAARGSRNARRLLGAKLALDAGMASVNAVRQVVSFGKLCSWCTGTALATAVAVYGGRSALKKSAREAQRFVA